MSAATKPQRPTYNFRSLLLHSRYEDFIRRFRGPASKYLPLYLSWFLYAQRRTEPRTAFAEIIRA